LNSPPHGFIKLSTDQFPECDRAEVAREVFGRMIIKAEFEPLPDVPFHMDVVLRALPDFGLAYGTCSAKTAICTPQLSDSDDLMLTVALSGAGIFNARGRETQISAGSAALVSCEDRFHFCIPTRSELISFRIPINRIAPQFANLDAALAQPIPANTEALRLLVHYAGVLRDDIQLGTPEPRTLVVTHLHDLVALAIGATRDAAAVAAGRGVRAARLRAVKAYILDNLTDRQLTVESVAARCGFTSRHMGRLFESEATTFSEFVLVQRLDRARRMLIDPLFSDRTVSSVALESGFGDISYFNRAFRRHYGMTPSDVRNAVRRNDRT
jgi:AraC-like DNA-binding protein